MHGSRQRELSIRGHLIAIIFQQPRHVSVGNAVVVAAEADVVLFELNGPKGSVQFSVLILTVHVDSTHKAHQQDHNNDDHCQNNDVKLSPRNVCESRGAVVRGADRKYCL